MKIQKVRRALERLVVFAVALALAACQGSPAPKAGPKFFSPVGQALPVAYPAPIDAGLIGNQSADPATGAQWVALANLYDGGTIMPAPVAPAVYQDGGAALGTGTSWTAGPYAAVPTGAATVGFWITYTGIAAGAQLGYRINAFYSPDAGAGGPTRILNSSPSISGAVATQTSYQSAATFAETGTGKLVAFVPFGVSGGVVGVSLDLLEVVQPDAGSTYFVDISWSFN